MRKITALAAQRLAEALRARGAGRIYTGCTHPCFSGPAITNLQAADLAELVVTDTIPVDGGALGDCLKVLSVGDLFAEAIVRIHEERSLSGLFD